MERYGRATTEGSQSDPSPEGLEEAAWPLGFGGAESYPERPDEADCIFYLRTGYCGYGSRCRFNHPRDRSAVPGAGRGGDGEFPERTGQPICQYYMRTGTCKFGSSCKYHHPRQGGGSASILLNYLGYPMRQGERECSYYVKTGQCKFGPSCKFHHPQPAGLQLPLQTPAPQPPPAPVPAPAMFPPPVQSPSGSSSQQYNLMVARPSLLQGQFVQSPYGTVLISPGMVPYSGWPGTPYMPPVSPFPSPSYQIPSSAPPFHGSYQPNPSPPVNQMSGQSEPAFPERPGQPECQYYLRTGDCKFGSSCRYHHPPPEAIPPSPTVTLSPAGLPIRQGAPLCIHYAQRGVCKFGPSCRFDHPIGTLSYSPSASSLSDMPVAPYPVGSSVGTLAPSSSSSDLHPLGATKDSPSSARMLSSMSSSSGSVGSTFSKGSTVHSSSNVGPGTESRTSS